MWQTFQGALEKKIKTTGKKKKRIDKYITERALKEVLVDQFGQVGLSFINLEIENPSVVVIRCKNSVWKNELRMRKGILIEKINKKMAGGIVNNIIIS